MKNSLLHQMNSTIISREMFIDVFLKWNFSERNHKISWLGVTTVFIACPLDSVFDVNIWKIFYRFTDLMRTWIRTKLSSQLWNDNRHFFFFVFGNPVQFKVMCIKCETNEVNDEIDWTKESSFFFCAVKETISSLVLAYVYFFSNNC